MGLFMKSDAPFSGLLNGDGTSLRRGLLRREDDPHGGQRLVHIQHGGPAGGNGVHKAVDHAGGGAAAAGLFLIGGKQVQLAPFHGAIPFFQNQRTLRVVIQPQHAAGSINAGRVILHAIIGPAYMHLPHGPAGGAVQAQGVVVHRYRAAVRVFFIHRAQHGGYLHHHIPQQVMQQVGFMDAQIRHRAKGGPFFIKEPAIKSAPTSSGSFFSTNSP